MEINANRINELKKRGKETKQFIHSPAHLLADELSKGFGDAKHFGFYLKLALKHNHDFLRKTAEEVREQKNVKFPAKLFVYLVKKATASPQNTENEISNS